MLFIDALRRVVTHRDYAPEVGFCPEAVREKHDGLVIPAANWLNGSSDWGGLADLIERSKLPCVLVGLGAQAPSEERVPRVSEGTRRLLHVAAERSHSVSVRGTYSAEMVERLGVKNVTVTGCPSLLWHVDRTPQVAPSGTGAVEKVTINASRENDLAALSRDDLRNKVSCLLSREALKHGYDFVIQTEAPDLEMVMSMEQCRAPTPATVDYLKEAFSADATALTAFFRNRVRAYFDPAEWIASMRGTDAVIGTRLHGVIAGLLAGTPSVLITHDTRTREMADHAAIPQVSANSVLEKGGISPRRLIEKADFKAFHERMQSYRRNFQAFFTANEVHVAL
ncbi:MAG: polysaccharide pyruvyl transferase family protein [Algiphilus sp.]|uniref:polysaccharide pyruvyl transferase family protein n=1 Tax=Algiphilus sp. TaxID=1872431 RepID=UPI0032ECDB07